MGHTDPFHLVLHTDQPCQSPLAAPPPRHEHTWVMPISHHALHMTGFIHPHLITHLDKSHPFPPSNLLSKPRCSESNGESTSWEPTGMRNPALLPVFVPHSSAAEPAGMVCDPGNPCWQVASLAQMHRDHSSWYAQPGASSWGRHPH